MLLPAEEGSDVDEDMGLGTSSVLGKRDPNGHQKNLRKPAVLLSTRLEEDDEMDEPVLGSAVATLPSTTDTDISRDIRESFASEEFSEARGAVAADPWDVSSWLVVVEEAQQNRSGNCTFASVCKEIFGLFPRAAMTYRKLALHLIGNNQFDEASQLLFQACRDCWDVDLWSFYLEALRKGEISLRKEAHAYIYAEEKDRSSPEDIERMRIEAEYQFALDQVGWSIESICLWQSHVQSLQQWPEIQALDASKKITALRKTYQRVVTNPATCDQVKSLWKEYEELEKQWNAISGAAPEGFLADLRKKHHHACELLRERMQSWSKVEGGRWATPPLPTPLWYLDPDPTKGFGLDGEVEGDISHVARDLSWEKECQQLEHWSAYLVAEEEILCKHLSPAQLRKCLHSLFQQCLSQNLRHLEVWVAYGLCEQRCQARLAQTGATSAQLATNTEREIVLPSTREILTQALAFTSARESSQSALLRVLLAEVMEVEGDIASALSTLRGGLWREDDSPDARMRFGEDRVGSSAAGHVDVVLFSHLQRFLKRHLGLTAARQLYSETALWRHDACPSTNSSGAPRNLSTTLSSSTLTLNSTTSMPPLLSRDELSMLGISLVAATFEWQNNAQPHVGMKILARVADALGLMRCLRLRPYISLYVQLCGATGDQGQCRWCLSAVLDQASLGSSSVAQAQSASSQLMVSEAEVLRLYITSELAMGASDPALLQSLRERLERAGLSKEQPLSMFRGRKPKVAGRPPSLHDAASSLCESALLFLSPVVFTGAEVELYSPFLALSSDCDSEALSRIQVWARVRNILASAAAAESSGQQARPMSYHSTLSGAGDQSQTNAVAGFLLDFTAKLPAWTNPLTSNDIDVFMRHMRTVLLPPRPSGPRPANSALSADLSIQVEQEEHEQQEEEREVAVDEVSTEPLVDDVFRSRRRV